MLREPVTTKCPGSLGLLGVTIRARVVLESGQPKAC